MYFTRKNMFYPTGCIMRVILVRQDWFHFQRSTLMEGYSEEKVIDITDNSIVIRFYIFKNSSFTIVILNIMKNTIVVIMGLNTL